MPVIVLFLSFLFLAVISCHCPSR